MISIAGLVKAYAGDPVLSGVSFEVRRGEVTALIGPSGGGKSTLLRCLNALETFEAGEVRVGDITLLPGGRVAGAGKELTDLRRRIGMVFQQFYLFPHLTALENVMVGPRRVLGLPASAARARAAELLDRVGLAERAQALPQHLSGGQQQRVAIARTLAVEPEAILFDQPTSALDPRMAAEVLRVIADLAAAGQTMIVVTHAMEFARQVAETVHVMSAGKIAASGRPADVINDMGGWGEKTGQAGGS